MIKIAYLTDVHIDEEFPKSLGVNARYNWEILLRDVRKRGIREIVFGGDMGEPSTNKWFFETLKDFEISITLGNHDHFGEVMKCFQNPAFIGKDELYYSFEKDNYLRIYLDSSNELITDKQFTWLEDQLKANCKILLFIHHAIFPVETPIDQKHFLRGRERIQQLLVNSGRDIAVFCGHYHMNDEQNIENVTQYITSAVSYQVIKSDDSVKVSSDYFGYRVINIDEDGLKTEIVRFDN